MKRLRAEEAEGTREVIGRSVCSRAMAIKEKRRMTGRKSVQDGDDGVSTCVLEEQKERNGKKGRKGRRERKGSK